MYTAIDNDFFEEDSRSLEPNVKREVVKPFGDHSVAQWSYQFNGHQIIRFVINSKEIKEENLELDKSRLHDIEKNVISLAKERFRAGKEFVVLIDLFERGTLGIHTVCLWQSPEEKITLIDPTKSSFTQFLERIAGIEVRRHDGREGRFYDRGLWPVGQGEYDGRDCIDIALKIGFVILENEKLGQEKVWQEVYKLSNQQALNEGLRPLRGIGLRTLQSPNPGVRKLVLDLINKNRDVLKRLDVCTLRELEDLERKNETEDLASRVKALETVFNTTGKIPLWKFVGLETLMLNLEKFNTQNALTLKYFPGLAFAFSKDKTIAQDELGYTDLHKAVQANNLKEAKRLFHKTPDAAKPKLLMAIDMYGQTALHWAAGKGYVDIAIFLVSQMNEEGILIQAEGNYNYTALHLSVHSRSTEIVACLVEKERSLVGLVDRYGQTALHWAASTAQEEIATLLVGNMTDTDIMIQAEGWKNFSALHFAVHSRNSPIVSLISKRCPQLVEIADGDGRTPLEWAKSSPEIRGILEAAIAPPPERGGAFLLSSEAKGPAARTTDGPKGSEEVESLVKGPTGATGATGATGPFRGKSKFL